MKHGESIRLLRGHSLANTKLTLEADGRLRLLFDVVKACGIRAGTRLAVHDFSPKDLWLLVQQEFDPTGLPVYFNAVGGAVVLDLGTVFAEHGVALEDHVGVLDCTIGVYQLDDDKRPTTLLHLSLANPTAPLSSDGPLESTGSQLLREVRHAVVYVTRLRYILTNVDNPSDRPPLRDHELAWLDQLSINIWQLDTRIHQWAEREEPTNTTAPQSTADFAPHWKRLVQHIGALWSDHDEPLPSRTAIATELEALLTDLASEAERLTQFASEANTMPFDQRPLPPGRGRQSEAQSAVILRRVNEIRESGKSAEQAFVAVAAELSLSADAVLNRYYEARRRVQYTKV